MENSQQEGGRDPASAAKQQQQSQPSPPPQQPQLQEPPQPPPPQQVAKAIPDNPLLGHPRYQQIRFINRGAYGFVLLALDKETGEHIALKFIERGAQITKYVEREILNQLRLRHPHIIALKEVFLTDDYLVLAMEYAPGGDLFKVVSHLRGLSEDNARWFFQQIILAIDYCHRMGVANRDIKLENTLLDGSAHPLVKLADFGFSKDENYQSAPGSRVGTPAYLAPEVITNVQGQSYDAKKADVWSCGVLLYIMVTGSYPFRKPEDEKQRPAQRLHVMLQRILSVRYSFPADVKLSDPCKNLISSMLVADPTQRPSIQQVLHHPWCSAGLEPSMFQFNDSIVATSLANQPPAQLMEEIQNLVREAQHVPQQAQQAQQAKQPAHPDEVMADIPEFDPSDYEFQSGS